MARLLGDPREPDRRRAARHQHEGLRAAAAASRRDDVFRVGYFARIAPEKGLHVLAEAYALLPPRGRRQRAACGSRRPAISRRAHAPYLEDVKRAASTRPGSATSSPITARSIATASWRSCRRSTCCRCRRPTTSRRACSCSRRWRAACRWCSRGAARSPRSSRRPAAACSWRRTIRRRWPTGCTSCGSDRAQADALGARGFDGVRAHYSVERSADRLLDVYDDRSVDALGLVTRQPRTGDRAVGRPERVPC